MTLPSATTNGQCVDVGLSAVPETMLWTLHNRCSVASDPDRTWFADDKAVEIYGAIDYDYEKSFGKAEESHAIRSWLFDQGILEFWKANPEGGTIVNFAEGVETQRFRLQDSRPEGSLWITIDLPSAISAREKFIQPDDENLHVAASVFDTGEWMHLVPNDKPVFFTAQGLFMYLEEEENRKLFQKIAKEFPSSTIWFDSIAKWLSSKTMGPKGWVLTDHYTAPKMPFGVAKNNAPGLFKSWVPGIEVEEVPWPIEKASGFFMQYVVPILMSLPLIKNIQPGFVMKVKFPPSSN
jgi:O-methyltransferase involved in polyketide biosynthesis